MCSLILFAETKIIPFEIFTQLFASNWLFENSIFFRPVTNPFSKYDVPWSSYYTSLNIMYSNIKRVFLQKKLRIDCNSLCNKCRKQFDEKLVVKTIDFFN